jgi:hypothetical protein
MKASPAIIQALADIERIEKGTDVTRVVSEMLLGVARKEVSATDLEAASKAVAALAAHKHTELKVAMWAHEMRSQAAVLAGPKKDGE